MSVPHCPKCASSMNQTSETRDKREEYIQNAFLPFVDRKWVCPSGLPGHEVWRPEKDERYSVRSRS